MADCPKPTVWWLLGPVLIVVAVLVLAVAALQSERARFVAACRGAGGSVHPVGWSGICVDRNGKIVEVPR